jgi:hypothetical protein
MITMKEWMELVEYRITEGSAYSWQCYGHDAYALDSWNGDQDGYSFTVIFDTKDQTVYEVQAHDYLNQRAYRMINEDFQKKLKKEAKRRDVEENMAWELDDGTPLEYIDLEVDDDFIQKCLAIIAKEPYDTRVTVPLDLDQDTMYNLMKLAHENDITLNQMVELLLRDMIDNQQELLNN